MRNDEPVDQLRTRLLENLLRGLKRKKQMVRVDIILPVYNGVDLLPYALESILAQTHQDWYCYLVDDGSEDATRSVLEAYAAKDERFQPIFLEHGGISKALNAGLAAGNSDIIARLDADDMWHPEHLERCLQALDQYPIDLVSTVVVFVDHHESFTFPPLPAGLPIAAGSRDVYDYLLVGNPLSHPTVVFKRQLLADVSPVYQSQYDGLEDFDLWCRILTPTNSAILGLGTVAYNIREERDLSQIYPRVASRATKLRQQRGLSRQEHEKIKERYLLS